MSCHHLKERRKISTSLLSKTHRKEVILMFPVKYSETAEFFSSVILHEIHKKVILLFSLICWYKEKEV